MRQTLFYIPETFFGVPVFGWGLGLGFLVALVVIVHCYQYIRHKKVGDIVGSLTLLGIGGVMLVFILPSLTEPGLGVAIRGYGVFLLLAILAAFVLLLYLAKQQGIATDTIFSLAFWTVIAGILGARLFYVTEYWQEMFRFDEAGQLLLRESAFNVINFAQGGLVVFGSVLGGALGASIFMRRNKMPVLRTFDIMAPALVLGMSIGRFGCLLNGCCFGCVTDVSWGIVFPPGSPAHVHQAAHGDVFLYGLKFAEENIAGQKRMVIVETNSETMALGLKPGLRLRTILVEYEGQPMLWEPPNLRAATAELAHMQTTMPHEKVRLDFFTDAAYTLATPFWLAPSALEVLPVHPTQIYSSLLALLLCGTLLVLRRFPFYRHREGLVFASFMILYSIGRFFIEIIRTDEESFFGTGITVSQNVCIVVCLAGIALFVYACRRKTA